MWGLRFNPRQHHRGLAGPGRRGDLSPPERPEWTGAAGGGRPCPAPPGVLSLWGGVVSVFSFTGCPPRSRGGTGQSGEGAKAKTASRTGPFRVCGPPALLESPPPHASASPFSFFLSVAPSSLRGSFCNQIWFGPFFF
ncbi:UNVERIFIED_CONTAM: hypothetical protein K2H54_067412 [Gekko kuhli]